MKNVLTLSLCLYVISSIASADTFGTEDNQITIDFINISGDASSANGTNISSLSPGEDGYKTFTDPGSFRIGIYEITNDQWNKFVNNYGTVTGNPSYAYKKSAYFTGTEKPANNVSWYEVAQFINWLNTNKGYSPAYKFTGTQGQSDYKFYPWSASDVGYNPNNPFRNSNAMYFLPTDDEWVKAAYWNGITLQKYATKADEVLSQGDGSGTGWNYYNGIQNSLNPPGPWDVGHGSEELNGTFDMMGNVIEWLESPWINGQYSGESMGGTGNAIRGGGYMAEEGGDLSYVLRSDYRFYTTLAEEVMDHGFRVASIVPEPCSLILLALGALAIAGKKR